MDMKKFLQAVDGASSKKPAEGSNDMKRFMQIVEGKGPLNRLTQAESITVQTYTESETPKTITSPVLNIAKDAKPSMIGKYFKAVEQEVAEAHERTKDRAELLAEIVSKKIMERVTIGPDGQVTGGFKPTPADSNSVPANKAEPAPAEPPKTIPGASLPRVDSADREKQTVTIDGKEYPMVHLPPDSTIRPRGGKKYAIPLTMLGVRSIGNLVGILVGNQVIVLPKGQQ